MEPNSTKKMLTTIIPKLPMCNKAQTLSFYIEKLGFTSIGNQDFDAYLMLKRDQIELHFFLFEDLNPLENYGQVYIRCNNIETVYEQLIQGGAPIHPNGALATKPWGQKEFSILDPDRNLLTFGETA